MSSITKTVSSIFIVPTLDIDRDKLKDKNHNYINGYSWDKDRDTEDCVHLLFKPKDLDKFQEFVENERERTSSLVDDYDYPDNYVVLVYQLDSKFRGDFELIRQGKYSKTSEEFQSLFPKVLEVFKKGKIVQDESLQYRIFVKSDSLREHWKARIGEYPPENMELWDKFDKEKETLDIDKIREIYEQK